MIIIGCDFHTRYQQTVIANDETGELLPSGASISVAQLRTFSLRIEILIDKIH